MNLVVDFLAEDELHVFQHVLSQLQTFLIVTSVFVGIILWDLSTVIPEEMRYIFIPELKRCWSKRKLPGLPTVVLLALRLLTVPMMAVLLVCLTKESLSDTYRVTLTKVYLYLQTTGTLFACAIFVVRTVAIRDSKLPLKIFLWTYLLGVVGFEFSTVATSQVPYDLYSIEAYVQAGGADVNELLNQGINQMLHSWTIVLSLLIFFDTLIFVLCLVTRIHNFRWVSSRSRIARTFYRDAFWFFGVATTVTAVELVWIHLHRHSRLSIALIIPIQAWVTLSISPRVIRRLKLHSAKHAYENTHCTSASGSRPGPTGSLMALSPDSTKTTFSATNSINASSPLPVRPDLPRHLTEISENDSDLPFYASPSILICAPPRTLQMENSTLPQHTSRSGSG